MFFLGASWWLVRHPGVLAPLFAIGLAAGVLRMVLVARLPERSERTGDPIRVREALALLRTMPRLRSYLIGVSVQGALRGATIPFVIVMMRRMLGLSDADVMITTMAMYAGGLLSLYVWGRIVDAITAAGGRFGSAPHTVRITRLWLPANSAGPARPACPHE